MARIHKMQRIISNNDMDDSRSGPPILDPTTCKFLETIFNVLRKEDAIVVTGSCVVALTLQR
jgi:hypothetical protein